MNSFYEEGFKAGLNSVDGKRKHGPFMLQHDPWDNNSERREQAIRSIEDNADWQRGFDSGVAEKKRLNNI